MVRSAAVIFRRGFVDGPYRQHMNIVTQRSDSRILAHMSRRRLFVRVVRVSTLSNMNISATKF